MDIRKLQDVLNQARIYKIKCEYQRTGDFDYTVIFSDEETYTNGTKALKFIDALVNRYQLSKFTQPYRVGFGWEI